MFHTILTRYNSLFNFYQKPHPCKRTNKTIQQRQNDAKVCWVISINNTAHVVKEGCNNL
jgi:hypothetical protein